MCYSFSLNSASHFFSMCKMGIMSSFLRDKMYIVLGAAPLSEAHAPLIKALVPLLKTCVLSGGSGMLAAGIIVTALIIYILVLEGLSC